MFQNGKCQFRTPSAGEKSVSVIFGGDVCPGRIGGDLCRAGRASQLFAGVKDFLSQATLRVVQWETPHAAKENPIPKCGPNLNSADETAGFLTSAGFDVALLANNHTGDQGPENVLRTIEVLKKRNIECVGAGGDAEDAAKPLTLERGGRKWVLLNYCEHEFGTADDGKPGTAGLDAFDAVIAVRQAKAANPDAVVLVALHGGHEYYPLPSPRMQKLFRALADAGADMVFNCHTHCIGAIEIYRNVPLITCPGNLYFPELNPDSFSWHCGYLVKCSFDSRGAYELELLPYHYDDEKVLPLDAAQKPEFFAYMDKLCQFPQDKKALRRMFETWCSQAGFNYLKWSVAEIAPNWDIRLPEEKVRHTLLGLRHLFTCESHRDICDCAFRLIEEERLDEVKSHYDEIIQLQKLPYEK